MPQISSITHLVGFNSKEPKNKINKKIEREPENFFSFFFFFFGKKALEMKRDGGSDGHTNLIDEHVRFNMLQKKKGEGGCAKIEDEVGALDPIDGRVQIITTRVNPSVLTPIQYISLRKGCKGGGER